MKRKRGVAMLEFALVAPMMFFILVGLVDFMRLIEVNSIVADAARQGARQASANGSAADQPWGAADSNPCQGTSFAPTATGHGCLTDGRIKQTVSQVMQQLGGNVTLFSNTLAGVCAVPAAGDTNVCVAPAETGAAAAYADCPSARTALTHDPRPGELGSRNAEWTFPKFKGCFLVQVTVVYNFKPWTAFGPSIPLKSSTSMLGEEF
jgi:Flp pilus assembly protein TadG